MRKEFLTGYREVAGPLPPSWEEASKLVDLASICSFLDVEEAFTRTIQTAKYVVGHTLNTTI